MTDALLSEILQYLEFAVIERLPNAAFHAISPLPEWLADAFAAGPGGPHGTLGGAFPFLEDFLPQAEGVWRQGNPASAESGPFASRVRGEDLLLRAFAITLASRPLLILERLTGIADTRPVLQRAREELLQREQVVKQIATLRPPANAMAQTLEQLAHTTLTDEQTKLVGTMRDASLRIRAVLDALPMPPAKTSRIKPQP